MARKKKKAIEQAKSSDIQAVNFEADAGQGLEGTDKQSFAIPFLVVLQGLSPQLETVKGAKPGMLLNTITDELASELNVIPCAYQRRFLRWASRTSGGGYGGDYDPIEVETGQVDDTELQDGRWTFENGDVLRDTRQHYVLMSANGDSWQPALLSLSSTQIKKSKRWMSRIQSLEMTTTAGKVFTPPSFSHCYKLTTIKEENNKGSWYGIVIDFVGPLDDSATYRRAKAFHDTVVSGDIETQQPQSDAADEIPF